MFFVLVATAAFTLGGCSDGKNGVNGTNAATPTTGTVSASTFTNDNLNNVIPVGKILSASIPGKNPVVTFQVVDKVSGAGITGLKTFGLHIAKLVPETNGSSSYWVNYIDKGISMPAPLAFAVANGRAVTGAITKPSADPAKTLVTSGQNGLDLTKYPVGSVLLPGYTVVDNGDGTYTATFGSDITSNSNAPFDPTAIHRIGVTVTTIATPGVTATGPLDATGAVNTGFLVQNRLAMVYDFTPATGAIYTNPNGGNYARDIVTTAACNGCHASIAFVDGGHSARPNTQLCVMCHTSTNTSGEGQFVTFIHRIHMGGNLPAAVQAESVLYPSKPLAQTAPLVTYNLSTPSVDFPLVGYPQDIRNCTTCHKGVDGANWSTKPNVKNCGSCHNGINFAAGTGTTNNGLTTGHVGGPQANDTGCIICHNGAAVTTTHQTNDLTPNNPVTPAGVSNLTYAISSVTLNVSKQPVIVFQIKKDGTTVTTFSTPGLVTDAVTGQQVIDPAFAPITGFIGGPSLYIVYSVPQDGIAAPADFNARSSVSLASLLVTSGSPKAGTLTGPDANGFWTATLTGDTVGQSLPATGTAPKSVTASPIFVPVSAKMLTGALIGTFTQTNLATYPYTAKSVAVSPNTPASGGLVRNSLAVQKVATGFTARRAIVDTARCNNCHEQLGTIPNFHGGARNDATLCAFCHNANLTSSGWSANVSTFIHGIHGASKRSVPFTWHAVSLTDTFAGVTYPGYLRNCEQCHISGSYDFSATASINAVPSLLWSTVASGSFNGADATQNFMYSPYVIQDNITSYGSVFSYAPATNRTTAATVNTLVNSPISAACFSCHDTSTDKAHMVLNGGSIYEARSTALAKTETCLVCHGTAANTVNATVPTIKAVHRWW
jgi:OmcA/MtrC family decaheme c-type cytochrome